MENQTQMEEIKLEKKIPIPEIKYHSPKKYPFENMMVGDSFYVSLTYGRRVYSAACMWSARHGKKWKFREKQESNGIRIWRIK